MISLGLCGFAFVLTYTSARHSLARGLLATLAVGYGYGITRANFLDTYSYFLFDVAVLGLYAGQLFRPLSGAERVKLRQLRTWIFVLIGWPVLLALLPFQDPLIRLVGLRGAIFFLPFILLGARLQARDLQTLAIGIAALNLGAAALAAAEFMIGIEPFFPLNATTDLIYRSGDLVGFTAHRIPSSFPSAAAYAGTMVMTMPLLFGAWQQTRGAGTGWRKVLITIALPASALGVFMGASRSHAVVLFLLAAVLSMSTVTGQLRWAYRLKWLVLVACVAWAVSSDQRLQRFTTLADTEFLDQRFTASVNATFFGLIHQYPMGNGLGGGGTSVPFFLRDRLNDPVLVENEYARIALEQGIPGLMLWLVFLAWILSRPTAREDTWYLARRLAWVGCAANFALGLTGTGLFTSVPHTCLLLLTLGWVAVPSAALQRSFAPVNGTARSHAFSPSYEATR